MGAIALPVTPHRAMGRSYKSLLPLQALRVGSRRILQRCRRMRMTTRGGDQHVMRTA